MHFDAANHPKPKLFEEWANGSGQCPYSGLKVERAAWFEQEKEHWAIGQDCRPYDLMTRVLAEKCPNWTKDQRDKFAAKFKKSGNKK